ncbi:MAG: XTP/dITP diphosphatase [Eubacteriaceae bacterium]
MRIVLATNNNHKKDEIKSILGDDYDVLTMGEKEINIEIVEDGSSFEDNALIKARALKAYSDDIIIADDSGLEVDALNGQPGIYSARYAGEKATYKDNNEKLLLELGTLPLEKRKARFVSVIAIILPNAKEFTVRGICDGIIAYDYMGEMGFGYDPLFIVENTGKTFAQMTSKEKNNISHRGRALKKLKELLQT